MSIREIKKFNDFLLYQKTKEVITSPGEKFSPEIENLVRDLKDTVVANKGIGLAANQIGIPLRVIVIDLESRNEEGSRKRVAGKGNRFLVLLNPKIIARRGKQVIEEGCLSFPGIYLKIRRSRWVRVNGIEVPTSQEGKPLIIEAEGILAQVFQHEIDHLEGKVFINRLPFWKRWKIWRQIRKTLIKRDKIQDLDRQKSSV